MGQYRRLTRPERYQIEVLLKRGDGIREIARILDRSPSSISREIRRNQDPLTQGVYWARSAEERTHRVRRRFRHDLRRIERDPVIQAQIEQKLRLNWSPEQVSGRMRRESPRTPAVSYSTIYRFIYRDYLRGGELWKAMRKPRYKRRKMSLLKNRPFRGQIMNRVSIEDRPQVINERKRRGDFERDTIQGKAEHSPVLLSIVDRKSKLTRLAYLKKKTSKGVHGATISLLRNDPHLKSITNDNGREFSWHERTRNALGSPIYFTHPHSSWERGTNENTNGLIRQYFPRGSDFRKITKAEAQAVENLLNQRPRKSLGYKTPLEVHLGA